MILKFFQQYCFRTKTIKIRESLLRVVVVGGRAKIWRKIWLKWPEIGYFWIKRVFLTFFDLFRCFAAKVVIDYWQFVFSLRIWLGILFQNFNYFLSQKIHQRYGFKIPERPLHTCSHTGHFVAFVVWKIEEKNFPGKFSNFLIFVLLGASHLVIALNGSLWQSRRLLSLSQSLMFLFLFWCELLNPYNTMRHW